MKSSNACIEIEISMREFQLIVDTNNFKQLITQNVHLLNAVELSSESYSKINKKTKLIK